jgi:predicted nuclease of predicted toxin-antitoxin system
MRFKLDENLSRSIAELFRTQGHDVMTVRDQALQGASDEKVYEVSVREDRALVTFDRDLGQVLRFPPGASAGIIVIDTGPQASRRGLLERKRELHGRDALTRPRAVDCRAGPGAHPPHGQLRIARRPDQDMDFRIADTFTASLARLTGAEQKAVKTTAFDLQLNASAPACASTGSTVRAIRISGRCASMTTFA